MMKAAVVEVAGRSPVHADFAEPGAGDGEALISVTAAAISPLAKARASGAHYSAGAAYPLVAGVDGVGRLDDGRRVYFMLPRAPFGAMAERTVVPQGQWTQVPDGIDDATAAVIANPGMSSWAALTLRAGFVAGETVLVNGGTGAAGSLAIRIARHLGAARVIVSGRNRDVLDSLGADETVLIGEDEAAMQAAFAAVFADGVDVVLDYLWGPSALGLLLAAVKAPAARRIRFVQIGSLGGATIALPSAVLRSSKLELVGSGLGSVGLDQLVGSVGAMLRAAGEAQLELPHRVVPLADVAATWDADGDRIVYRPG